LINLYHVRTHVQTKTYRLKSEHKNIKISQVIEVSPMGEK